MRISANPPSMCLLKVLNNVITRPLSFYVLAQGISGREFIE